MNKLQVFKSSDSPFVFVRFDENYPGTALPKQSKVALADLILFPEFKALAKTQYGVEFNSFNLQIHPTVSPLNRIILGENELALPIAYATLEFKEKLELLLIEIDAKSVIIEPPKLPKLNK